MVAFALSLFSLAACPPPPAPSADAQPDAQPEAAVPSDAQSDAGGAMDVASQPDASNGDAAAIACCVALAGTAQSVCDPLAALGPDRCNMINGGTSCAWNPAAACNGDAGASQPDVVRPDANASSCCVARPGTAQSVCDPLVALGPDRCNMINGGASCMWAGGAMCGDASAPADSGVRVDSGVSVDSGVRVDSGVAGCCRARPGIAQATCDAVASLGQDRCNMLNGGASCAWLTGGECLTDAGPRPDASCCTARAGVAQATCDAVASLGRDRCNMLNAGASCSWTCL